MTFFFRNEANYRRGILQKWFPLYVIKTQENQNYEFLFSRIGPPHLYTVDIYPQKLVFIDEDNNKVGVEYSTPKNANQASRLERFFITGTFEPQAKKCLVYSVYNDDAFCLFEFPLSRNEFDFSSQYKQLPFALSGEFDAKETSANTVTVKPSFNILPDNLEHYANKRGRIKLKLKEHLNMDALLHFGLLISPDININIGVRIFDENNKSAFRYYLPLSGNEENLVLLNWLGFDNYNNLSKNITEIVIYIYTDKLEKEGMNDFSVKVNSLIGFENNIELYKFFKEKQFVFPERN